MKLHCNLLEGLQIISPRETTKLELQARNLALPWNKHSPRYDRQQKRTVHAGQKFCSALYQTYSKTCYSDLPE